MLEILCDPLNGTFKSTMRQRLMEAYVAGDNTGDNATSLKSRVNKIRRTRPTMEHHKTITSDLLVNVCLACT